MLSGRNIFRPNPHGQTTFHGFSKSFYTYLFDLLGVQVASIKLYGKCTSDKVFICHFIMTFPGIPAEISRHKYASMNSIYLIFCICLQKAFVMIQLLCVTSANVCLVLQLLPQRCSWLYAMNNVLMSVSGNASRCCDISSVSTTFYFFITQL